MDPMIAPPAPVAAPQDPPAAAPHDHPSGSPQGRRRAAALALGALLLAGGPALAAAAPASAATGDVVCPSAGCVRVAAGLGSPLSAVSDGAGSAYLPYQTGELRKVNLTTGAASTVATGLGNLRGVALSGGSAYVTSFDGTLQQVTVATGAHRTLAAGLPSLFGVARVGATTYATDGQGELLAVPDGGAPRVVTTGIGFSEGVAFDAAGFAYTADMMTGRVLQTNPATGATRVLATETYEPTSISVGPDGLVYFEVGAEVLRVNPATGQQSHVTNLVGLNPGDFTLASSGDAYAADVNGGGSVWKIAGLTQR
jgi:hypothetical protein